MLFTAAWMFVLGIIVGRYATPVDFDPQRIEKELADFRAAEMQKEKERLKAEAKALYDMDLDFYEDLTARVAQPLAHLRSAGPTAEGPSETPSSPPEMKRSLSTKSSVPTKPERPAAPEKPHAEISRSPAPKPPSPKPSVPERTRPEPPAPEPVAEKAVQAAGAAGGFAIQVASFVTASDADRTVAMLRRRGYAEAYRTEDNVPGHGTRYRVRIGEFRDAASARGVLTRLKSADRFQDAYILKNR